MHDLPLPRAAKARSLYTYAGDGKPGATTGQGLDQFGAEWYVVAPSGKQVEHG